MSENSGLEGIIGGESESVESPAASGSADPVAIAVAVDAARHDPDLSRKAGNYLDEQLALVKLQVRHFDQERRLAIHAAKLKRTMDWLKLTMQCFVALVLVGAVGGMVAIVWNAVHDTGLKIEAFSVPPDLATRGLTGEVLATRVGDQLKRLERQAQSVRPAKSYADNWEGEIKVEVPGTGVSIGELSRFLHDHFGNGSHIRGEVFRGDAGLTLSARVDHNAAIEAVGADHDLDKLVEDVALGIFSQSQPYRYGVWLYYQDRIHDATVQFHRLAADADPTERLWGLYGLGFGDESLAQRLVYERQAVELDPHLSFTLFKLGVLEQQAGHDEVALGRYRQALAAGEHTERRGVSTVRARFIMDINESNLAFELGDFATMRRAFQTYVESSTFLVYEAAAQMGLPHAAFAAHESQATTRPREMKWRDVIEFLPPQMLFASMQEDWSAIAVDLEALRAELIQSGRDDYVAANIAPALSEAYAHLGDTAKADALLSSIPNDVYDGWRARGRIAAAGHDWAGAARAFTEAVRLGPSLPRGYLDWGNMLAVQGDLESAIGMYAKAHARGPKWADPLKAWGDVLVKQGRPAEALAKYDEALKYAPNWAQLKEAQGRLAKQKS